MKTDSKKFETPTLEVIPFRDEDIITVSSEEPGINLPIDPID